MKFKIPTLRQKTWDYIRRNQLFRAGDIIMILDARMESVRAYIGQLERAGFIVCLSDMDVAFRDREYRALKISGIHAPSVADDGSGVIDHNTGKKIAFRWRKYKPYNRKPTNTRRDKMALVKVTMIKGKKADYNIEYFEIKDSKIIRKCDGKAVDTLANIPTKRTVPYYKSHRETKNDAA